MAINKDKILAAAQKFLQKGQIDKAIVEYQRLVEDDPKDVRNLLKVGDLLTRANRHADAAQTYSRVAQFYSEQGFFLKAVAVYKQILKIDPDIVEVNQKLGELYHQLGLVSDAVNQYRQLSALYDKLGKSDESAAVLGKMVEIDPENIPSRIKLAELHAKEDKLDLARSEFKAAAAALKAQHRIDDYAKVAERIVHFDPNDLATTRELANIYVQKGDARRALAKLQVCFKANPKDTETLQLLANAFKDLGQIPKTVSVYRELAGVHKDSGHHEAYVGVMRKILDLAPDDAEAQEAIAHAREVKPMSRLTPSQRPISPPPDVHEVDRRPPRRDVASDDIDLDMEMDKVASRPAAVVNKAEPPEDQITRILTEVDVYIKYGLKTKALEHVERVFDVAPNHREAAVRKKQLVLELTGPEAAVQTLLAMARHARQQGNSEQAKSDLEEVLGLDPQHSEARSMLKNLAPVKQPPAKHAELGDDLDALLNPPAEPAATSATHEEMVVEVGMDEMLSEEPAPTTSLSYDPSPAAAAIDLDEGLEDEAPPKVVPTPARVAPAKQTAASFDADLDALLKSAVPAKHATGSTKTPAARAPKAASPPPEPTPAPPESDRLAEEIEEVEFFLQQGLESEARDALAGLVAHHPEDPGVLALQAKIDLAAAEAAPPKPAEVAPTEDAEPEPEMEAIDIAEEIEREAQDAGDDNQVPFDDVFEQFKRGVAKQVDESDHETHYNLGIAYKEMGLLDDAVREFSLAQKANERAVDAITMIGLCQLAKGNAGDALDYFLKGLNSREVTPQGAMALRYEIGQAYESMSRFREATKFYEKVHAMDTTFRDVSARLDHVKKLSHEQKDEASVELDALLTDAPAEDEGGDKSSKISYV